jgi:hypothetical protein
MNSRLEFFIYIYLQPALWPWTQPLTEISTRNISWGVKAAGADNLTTFMCRLSRNLGASNSWNPKGPVQACNEIALLCFTRYYILVNSSESFNLGVKTKEMWALRFAQLFLSQPRDMNPQRRKYSHNVTILAIWLSYCLHILEWPLLMLPYVRSAKQSGFSKS